MKINSKRQWFCIVYYILLNIQKNNNIHFFILRYDRIILGEVRDAAACELLSVMNTGHDGNIKKVHVITQKQY